MAHVQVFVEPEVRADQKDSAQYIHPHLEVLPLPELQGVGIRRRHVRSSAFQEIGRYICKFPRIRILFVSNRRESSQSWLPAPSGEVARHAQHQ